MTHPNRAFRLQVHLAVSGPDLRVESSGCTAQEAMLNGVGEVLHAAAWTCSAAFPLTVVQLLRLLPWGRLFRPPFEPRQPRKTP